MFDPDLSPDDAPIDSYAEIVETPIPLLVVDSDRETRQRLAGVFTAGGYTVRTAEDGIDALEEAQRHRFHLVITDLDMPRMDGIDLVQELKKLDPYIECILLSGSDYLPRVIEAAEGGNVYNHFWKPLNDIGDLARSVARALELRSLRLSNARLLSELRDAREELRFFGGRLEQLDKVAALGQMTGTVARGMESPLQSLLAYAKYLRARLKRHKDEPLSPAQIDRVFDYMGEMEAGVRKCQEAVQGVLEYTQVHAEPPGPVSLHEVILEAVGLLRNSLDAQGISLNVNLAEYLPPVLANPRRLQQALVNVLLNAQQALTKGEGAITLTTEALRSAKGREIGVLARIADTGEGIAPGVLPHVFDPFFTTRPHAESLGIGLTIARDIVQDWGGEIKVESAPSQGTTVTFTLPLCAEVAVPIPPRSESLDWAIEWLNGLDDAQAAA